MDEGQFLSLRVGKQPDLTIYYDHRPIPAYRGETVIAALLRQQRQVSFSEFDGAARAGFCLMGACQDCSVWTYEGERLRACRAIVEDGQKLLSRAPMHGFSA
ncbi:(2Fe-2S)-binding protein [Brucella oryzae]|uniref:NAD(FAD)-dependent dehydrogenase n=1 Tax=Brucella oryzae TaxID=335286 RepID=A0A2S7IV41_9HYPH|nr:(2Fe-2S)-binding protein [Brucella oryzae]MBR7654316.1 (2Fe-2S)-binding protein [Brucella oryzae]PQA71887.1 NAD(FAD)-dependent dehydrogenase [Brucella oryzae]